MFVPLGGLCFLMALFVVDNGLPDESKPSEQGVTVAQGDLSTPPARTLGDATVPETLPSDEKKLGEEILNGDSMGDTEQGREKF